MSDPFGLVGTTIAGKYRVERVLGEGGFGIVYAATQAMLNERVAIKLIKPGAAGATAFTAATFLREARLLFKLAHPGIVRMYEVGEVKTPQGDAPFVVLELLEGTPLDQEIRRRGRGEAPPFTALELRAVFEPILEALAFAHGQGIVHRDIKPSNIMVLQARGGGLTAKILDFGMAAGAPGSTSMTAAGLTPLYASPEQWNATFGSIGPASDVFALGLCFEEAATLRPAVLGDSVPEIVASATNTLRGSRIGQDRPDLPRALEAFAVKATRVWPPERFASAQQMLEALRAAYNNPSLQPSSGGPAVIVSAPPASPYAVSANPGASYAPTLGRSAAVSVPVPPAMQPAPAPKKSGVPLGCIIGGIGGFLLLLLLLLGGGGAAYFLAQNDSTPSGTGTIGPTPTPSPSPTPTLAGVDAGLVKPPNPNPNPTPTPTTKPTPGPNPTPNPTPGPTPSPSPSPSPKPPAGPVSFYAIHSAARGGLDPDFPKFSAVVTANGSSMKRCWVQEGITDEWSAGFEVTFRGKGVKGIRNSYITHGGTPDTSIVGTRIRECITNEAIQWKWPDPPPADDLQTKPAYIKILTGMSARPPG